MNRARRYLFVNLKTGVSQWEFPDSSNAPASSSQEMVLHRPAPGHNPQDPELSKPRDFDRYSLALEDIPRLIAIEQAKGGAGLSSSSANALNNSKSSSQSLGEMPHTVLSSLDGNTLVDTFGTNSSTTSFDGLGVGMPSEGKKKSSFFSKLKRKSGAFI